MQQRRRQIRELIEQRERVGVDELARRFATSVVTIRSDLNALAADGGVVRTHGGAMLQREAADLPLAVKKNQHHAEKVRIAELAAAQVRDGQTILLDSGSTTAEIARRLRATRHTQLNVITNALNVAALLAPAPHITLIMPGGVLRPNSYSLSGPQAESALQGLNADLLFLGVDSLDPEIGLMTPHVLEARLNAQMIRIARRVIAVADSSKLMRRSLAVIARVEQIHMLITDRSADPGVVEALRGRGIEVLIA